MPALGEREAAQERVPARKSARPLRLGLKLLVWLWGFTELHTSVTAQHWGSCSYVYEQFEIVLVATL